jgi:hypothetical protein
MVHIIENLSVDVVYPESSMSVIYYSCVILHDFFTPGHVCTHFFARKEMVSLCGGCGAISV